MHITRASEELPGNENIATFRAKDLTADSAMMFPSEIKEKLPFLTLN